MPGTTLKHQKNQATALPPILPVRKLRNPRLNRDSAHIFIDHGGSGAYGAVGMWNPSEGELQDKGAFEVVYSEHFARDLTPLAIIEELIASSGLKIAGAVYGAATRIQNNCGDKGTHTPHPVDGNALAKECGFPVIVRNDYGLVGACIADGFLASEICLLTRGIGAHEGHKTGIGLGSGVGVVEVNYDQLGKTYSVKETEGSHAALAIKNDRELQRLQDWLYKRYEAVDYDMMLCGSGLDILLDFVLQTRLAKISPELRQLLKRYAAGDPSAPSHRRTMITNHALAGTDDACIMVWQLFTKLLGVFAQATAFLHNSTELVFTGGLVSNLVRHQSFKRRFIPHFDEAFYRTRKGVDRDWLATIRRYALRDAHGQGLRGAALIALMAA